jgi:hypothetical protein
MFVILDLDEYFEAPHFGEIQVQDNDLWPGSVHMRAFMAKKGQRGFAVTDGVQRDGTICIVESFPCQTHVAGIVFNQQNIHGAIGTLEMQLHK